MDAGVPFPAIMVQTAGFGFGVLSFFLLWTLGCGPSNDSLREKLEGRARFDLNCRDIQLVPLEETNGYVTSYGVTGCNRRVTYVINAATQSWVMNVDDGNAPSNRSAEPPVPTR